MVGSFRAIFMRTADALINQDKYDSAKKVLTKMFETFPDEIFPYDIFCVGSLEQLIKLGEYNLALDIATKLYNNSSMELAYYLKVAERKEGLMEDEITKSYHILYSVYEAVNRASPVLRDSTLKSRYETLKNEMEPQIKEFTIRINKMIHP